MYARFVILSGLVGAVASGVALAADQGDVFRRLSPDDIVWHEQPDSFGVKQAVIAGDPKGTGLYVIRVRFPPHVMDRPHYHPNARYVTVMEGTWCSGTGDRFMPTTSVPIAAGGFMYHPAKAVHWDGSCGDKPVVVQITGLGPADTVQVDPKEPMWVKVGN
jgi:hypothetical protein